MGTHVSQCKPEEVTEEASNFMDVMRRPVDGPHRDWHFILNMDQTPVYFMKNNMTCQVRLPPFALYH
jgi:hypothetical protein